MLDDLFDTETALCSEGVWHNSWLGIGCALGARQLRALGDETDRAERLSRTASKTAESMLRLLASDRGGFVKRSATGVWESAEGSSSSLAASGEDPSFYLPSAERRCISNGAALIFFSLLAEEERVYGPGAADRFRDLASGFTSAFFDASCGRFRRAADDDASITGGSHWRAVDQAVGSLACMRLARLGHEPAASRAMAASATDSLLRDFGYSLYATEGVAPATHLDPPQPRPRNSWHDALACYALLATGCLGVGGESPAALVAAMKADYASPEGHLYHVPRERAIGLANRVMFSSTQALWTAVSRAAAATSAAGGEAEEGGAAAEALRAFYDARASSGLLPVADVYPDARLWANTEFAGWLLMDSEDFSLRRRG